MKEAPEMHRAGKKLWWRSPFGVIEIRESQYRKGNELVRAFPKRARVKDKLRRHDGFEVPVSCIRAVTLRHAEALQLAAWFRW